EVAMSRSAFAARFTELVGEPAMHYVTRWRMQVAASTLQDGNVTVGELATQLGCRSEAAFARAFKRTTGLAPGAMRRALQSTGAATPLLRAACARRCRIGAGRRRQKPTPIAGAAALITSAVWRSTVSATAPSTTAATPPTPIARPTERPEA